jgi:radical SAM-linked protein
MVPKPHTPMQWEPYVAGEDAQERIRFVRERFRMRKHVRITWSHWEIGYIESVFARGDRQLAPMILEAARSGMIFESNEKSFRGLDAWKEIFARHGYDSDARVFRRRELDEVFPWDFIHAGATKGFLKEEWKKMYKPETPEVPDCRWGACNHCGIPGNYQDIKLSPTEPGQITLPPPGTFAGKAKAGPAAGLPPEAEGRTPLDPSSMARLERGRVTRQDPSPETGEKLPEDEEEKSAASSDIGWNEKTKSQRGEPWLIRFSKTGLARFLSHHGTMGLLEKSMRRAGLKLFYSRGFSPKPRFKNAGALPVGLSTLSEPFMVELETAPEDPSTVPGLLSAFLPQGFEVVAFERAPNYDLPVPPTMTYRLLANGDAALLREAFQRWGGEPLPDVIDGRGRPVRTSEEVTELRMDGDDLLLSGRVNEAGNTVSVYALLSGATGLSLDQLRQREVVKLP